MQSVILLKVVAPSKLNRWLRKREDKVKIIFKSKKDSTAKAKLMFKSHSWSML